TGDQQGLKVAKKIAVARVNGVAITLNDLIIKMNQLASVYIPESHERTPEMDQAVKQEALDILIFRELAVQEAVRQGLKIPPGALDNFIQSLKKDMGSEDAFNDYLIKTDSTEGSLKKEFERNQLFDMIASKEIYLQAENDEPRSIQMRKLEWESELKKNATIEILLEEVEKKLKEGVEKPGNQ
ncbi:MAG: SurA N-terminal domain-containing protein, partial [Thermodesulfovibrionales bacterium]